jgi:hypothetical protein
MPATKLSEIKNAAKAVEIALARAHASAGGKPVLPRSAEDNDDVWILPGFHLGPASGHRHKRPDGQWDFDLFRDCMIEFELSVPRVATTPKATIVATYELFDQEITRIALALDPARWGAINALLPYHALTKLVPAGITQGFDAERGEDRATLRYACWLGVRPEAWPTDLSAYSTF